MKIYNQQGVRLYSNHINGMENPRSTSFLKMQIMNGPSDIYIHNFKVDNELDNLLPAKSINIKNLLRNNDIQSFLLKGTISDPHAMIPSSAIWTNRGSSNEFFINIDDITENAIPIKSEAGSS